MFVSLWNPHVPILPTIALTFVCAAIACGEVALLPMAAFLASFVAQTYIGLVPCAAGLCVIAIVSAAAKSRLERGVWIDAGTRRAVNLTAWLLVLLGVVRLPTKSSIALAALRDGDVFLASHMQDRRWETRLPRGRSM